ncbi:MAG: winged helix-turn-helix domain-containing protein [Acidobacteriia bacterium]|nr:winged helix-turn-helix domain-containing protein [Terriglobia bacterium]
MEGRPIRFRFGPYEADAERRELRKGGLRIRVRDKSFEVLAALLEHRGEVVTRDELRRRLWPGGIFVDFENSLNSAVNRLRDALGDSAAKPRFIETWPRRGYRFMVPAEPSRAAPPTLAVLPFENLSHDPEQDFFGDAVADALTTELGSLSTLRVISRQTALHLKGTRKTIPEIGRELMADAIIEGSVLRAGNRIRITAQLIQVFPEQHLWAKTYNSDLADIVSLQGQVAQAIAGAVQLAIAPHELARLVRPRPVDPEAHLAYLRGRHHMSRWSRESFEKALEYFQMALAKDPDHALSYAHMADCYALLGFWGHHPFPDAYRKAKESALEAIARDDALSAAHWALGWATWMCDWDLDRCEAETLRAIELNPSDEHAHAVNSIFLITTSEDRARAASEMRLALLLDPLSEYVNANLAWIYLFVDDYDRAAEQARRTLELFPGSPLAYSGLGLAESCRCRYAQSIDALEKAVAISQDALSMAYLGAAYARAGNRDVASGVLGDLLSRSGREAVMPRCFVLLYAAIGDRDRAFEWMEKAYEAHDSGLFFLRVMPLYDPLRSDPRLNEMLRRLGIARC